MTPEQVLKMAKENGVKVVDLRFMDFPGLWQHFSVPVSELELSNFEDGFGFDGSSIRGWQPIHASDMLVIPDPASAKIDPFYKEPTLVLICNIVDPITREAYTRDPRNIARKAEAYLKSTGIGDTAYIGPEAEFFIFDDIRFDSGRSHAFYDIDSMEGIWNTGRDEGPNLGYKPRHKEGYFPVPPMDKFQDLRTEMMLTLESLGIDIEAQHHEVATAGQAEIDMRFKPLLEMADQLMWFKYVLKNVAHQTRPHGDLHAQAPLRGQRQRHAHPPEHLERQASPCSPATNTPGSPRKRSTPSAASSNTARRSAPLPTRPPTPTNAWSRASRRRSTWPTPAATAAPRSAFPCTSSSPKAKRIEFRTPDPSCNGYLAFSAVLMAALDGIQNKIDPGDPLDKDIYGLPPEELAEIPQRPGSLDEALEALEADHEFLLKGDVFTTGCHRHVDRVQDRKRGQPGQAAAPPP